MFVCLISFRLQQLISVLRQDPSTFIHLSWSYCGAFGSNNKLTNRLKTAFSPELFREQFPDLKSLPLTWEKKNTTKQKKLCCFLCCSSPPYCVGSSHCADHKVRDKSSDESEGAAFLHQQFHCELESYHTVRATYMNTHTHTHTHTQNHTLQVCHKLSAWVTV